MFAPTLLSGLIQQSYSYINIWLGFQKLVESLSNICHSVNVAHNILIRMLFVISNICRIRTCYILYVGYILAYENILVFGKSLKVESNI